MSTEQELQARLQLALLILRVIKSRTRNASEFSMVLEAIEMLEKAPIEEIMISIIGVSSILDQYNTKSG